jgi:chromosome segregation ATPase
MDWTSIGTGAVAVAGVVGSWLNYRKGLRRTISEAMKQQNVELQDLAATRLEEIKAITARYKSAVEDLEKARTENTGLTSLYEKALKSIRTYSDEVLQLRANVSAVEADNKALRQRIAGLERMANSGGHQP